MHCGHLPMGPDAALLGADGWGDSRAGDWHSSPIRLNDELRIQELRALYGQPRDALCQLLMRLGDHSAQVLREQLALTAPTRRDPSDDDWQPWFIRVLCGHTHGAGTVRMRPNLIVHTGAAEYGDPGIARMIELGS